MKVISQIKTVAFEMFFFIAFCGAKFSLTLIFEY